MLIAACFLTAVVSVFLTLLVVGAYQGDLNCAGVLLSIGGLGLAIAVAWAVITIVYEVAQ